MADDVTGEGHLDHDFLLHVGARIRALRAEHGYTVQQLADHAQISRRLLTQIEHGQANPSLVAVTRLARCLGTDFTTLLQAADDDVMSVRRSADHMLFWSSDAGSTAYLLIATADARTADLWRWRLMGGDCYHGKADPARSQELFHVLRGSLTLTADDHEVVVRAGGSARLRSDRDYSYRNDRATPVEFIRTVVLAS